MISYAVLIGSLLHSFVDHFSSCTDFACGKVFLTAAPMILVVLPICWSRFYANLTLVAYFSIMAISFAILLVIIKGPIDSNSRVGGHDQLNLADGVGAMKTIGSVVFSITMTYAIFHAYIGLENRTPDRFMSVISSSLVFGTFLSFIVGFIGYLSFTEDTNVNILDNFSGDVGAIVKFVVVIHLMVYTPGDFVIAREAVLNLFRVDIPKLSGLTLEIISTLAIISITAIACSLQTLPSTEGLIDVISLSGGVAASSAIYILPGMIGYHVLQDNQSEYIMSIVLFFFGMTIAIISIIGAII